MAIDFGKLAYLSENSQFGVAAEVDVFPNMSLDEAVSQLPVICMQGKAELIIEENATNESNVEALMEGASLESLMENAAETFTAKVKAVFQKIREAVASIVSKLKMYISRLVSENGKFFKKYQSKVDLNKVKGATFKGYLMDKSEPIDGLDSKMQSGEIENILSQNGFKDPYELSKMDYETVKTELNRIQDQSSEERRAMYIKKVTGEDVKGDGTWATEMTKKALGEKKELAYGEGMFDLKTVGDIMTNAKGFKSILSAYTNVQKNLNKSEKNLSASLRSYKQEYRKDRKDENSHVSLVISYANEYLKHYQEISGILGAVQKMRKKYQDIRLSQAKKMFMVMLKASGAKASKADGGAEGNEPEDDGAES